ncbi:polysaccharide pyruvyl transferase family protein [Leuconostoc mesenteroides]|uniref:polysaccharide pyruvyl transferase family protein n=1 Tax=Leuconostoc mesenteroides TaxID=1245 RepID=UPI003CEDB2A4
MNKYFDIFTYLGWISTKVQKRKDKIFFLEKKRKATVFLFGIPRHKNLGDQAIAYAERDFLKKVSPEYEVVEISEEAVLNLIPRINDIISKDDIIAFHGGGNMGDIWPGIEDLRQAVIQKFTHNPIILFPQTAYFTKESQYKNQSVKVYGANENLTLFARENETFKIMSKLFSSREIYMVPDIVLSLDMDISEKRERVSFFMRADREKNSRIASSIDIIQELLVKSSIKFTYSDTVIDRYKFPITEKNREKLLRKKWREFAKSKFIVTDRLHGMIFARITKTPAIVLDNNNHKVKNSYFTWLRDDPNIIFVDDKISDTQLIKVKKWLDNEVYYQSVESLENKFLHLEKMFKR